MRDRQYFNDDKNDGEQLSQDKGRLSERISAYAQLRMYKEAVIECKKLVSMDPEDPFSIVELGFNFEKNGEIAEAIKCYKYAVKKFPEYACAYTNLGYCFEKYKKRDDMAAVCYEKALELDSEDEWALNNMGVLSQRQGRRQDAFCYYMKACEASQKRNGYVSLHLLHNLAWGFYLCHDYKKAYSLFNQLLLKENYSTATSSCDFGCVKYKMGLYSDALSLFEKATQMEPKKKRYQGLYRLALKRSGPQKN